MGVRADEPYAVVPPTTPATGGSGNTHGADGDAVTETTAPAASAIKQGAGDGGPARAGRRLVVNLLNCGEPRLPNGAPDDARAPALLAGLDRIHAFAVHGYHPSNGILSGPWRSDTPDMVLEARSAVAAAWLLTVAGAAADAIEERFVNASDRLTIWTIAGNITKATDLVLAGDASMW